VSHGSRLAYFNTYLNTLFTVIPEAFEPTLTRTSFDYIFILSFFQLFSGGFTVFEVERKVFQHVFISSNRHIPGNTRRTFFGILRCSTEFQHFPPTTLANLTANEVERVLFFQSPTGKCSVSDAHISDTRSLSMSETKQK
jgi:hypothetical protein